METSKINKYLEKEEIKLEISNQSMHYLNEIRKWTSFFTILGFIMIGILVLFGLLFSTILEFLTQGQADFPFPSYLIGIFYLIFALIYLFPVLYLSRFSQSLKGALNSKDTEQLTIAFKNLKSHLKFLGIMTIIIISLYPISFIIMGISGLINIMN